MASPSFCAFCKTVHGEKHTRPLPLAKKLEELPKELQEELKTEEAKVIATSIAAGVKFDLSAPPVAVDPIGDLKRQIDALTSRVAQLESRVNKGYCITGGPHQMTVTSAGTRCGLCGLPG